MKFSMRKLCFFLDKRGVFGFYNTQKKEGIMRENQLSVHSENILPIIKKWLYSDKDIFIRELVSNATDALTKVRVLRDQGVSMEGELEISVSIDKKRKTVTISDTGIGMTEEEVEKYIA